MFIIAAEVYLFGAAIYAILGSGKKQWWADGDPKRKSKLPINLPPSYSSKAYRDEGDLSGTIQTAAAPS